MYPLSANGEPISLTEYCADIASGPKTHVVLLYDDDPSKRVKIKSEHVDEDTNFQEKHLIKRPGYSRVTFAYACNSEQVYAYFKTMR